MFLMFCRYDGFSVLHAHCEFLNKNETIFWLYWFDFLQFWFHVNSQFSFFLFWKLPKLMLLWMLLLLLVMFLCRPFDLHVREAYFYWSVSALCVPSNAFVMCLPCTLLAFLDWFESSDSCVSHSDLVVTCFCEMCALCVSHVHILVFTATFRWRVCLPHFFMSVWWRWRWCWCWCVYFIQFISVLSSLNRILIHSLGEESPQNEIDICLPENHINQNTIFMALWVFLSLIGLNSTTNFSDL